MIREASKIINCILEFCRENQEIIMYAGLTLLGAIVLIAIICAFLNRKDSTINIQEPLVKVTIEDSQKALKPADKACSEDSSSKDCVRESKPSSRTDCIESIVEYIQSISPELLNEVEIKVHDAEIRIRYSNDKARERVKNEEPQKPEEIQESEEVQEPVENQETEIINEDTIDNVTEDAIENVIEDATEGVIEDTTEGVTVRIKFGPDNINISRSGRVFSEEELEEQIRD